MVEIKFRAKDVNQYTDGTWRYGQIVLSENKKHGVIVRHVRTHCYEWDVDPETTGQYTGLKDKNGVEIYEGDLLERSDGTNIFSNDKKVFQVVYSEHKGAFHLTPSTFDHLGDGVFNINGKNVVEVIGNIHERRPITKSTLL